MKNESEKSNDYKNNDYKYNYYKSNHYFYNDRYLLTTETPKHRNTEPLNH